MNRLWLKMSLKDAIAAPIVFVDSENNVKLEHGFDKVKKPEFVMIVLISTASDRDQEIVLHLTRPEIWF